MSVEFSTNKLFYHQELLQSAIASPLNTYPLSLEVSLFSGCNAKCFWCCDKTWRKKHPGVLSEKLLIERLAEFYHLGARGLVIEGGGEPTLHPDFNSIVIKAHDIGFDIGLVTNGIAIPYEGIADMFSWIRISLDAYDKHSFIATKGVDKYWDVMANIAKLRGANLGIAYVLTKSSTAPDFSLLVDTLKKAGVRYVQFRRVMDFPALDPGLVDLSYLDRFNDEKFRVYSHQIEEFELPISQSCSAHCLTTVISASGDMFICCRLKQKDGDFGYLGNIKEQTVSDIWFGEERRNLTRNLLEGKVKCPPCRMNKYNNLIEDLRIPTKTRNFL